MKFASAWSEGLLTILVINKFFSYIIQFNSINVLLCSDITFVWCDCNLKVSSLTSVTLDREESLLLCYLPALSLAFSFIFMRNSSGFSLGVVHLTSKVLFRRI